MRISNWIAILPALALTMACATVDGNAGSGRAVSETVCLSDYQIRSFSPAGEGFLYVEGSGDRHYLFTMERGCFGLGSANAIGIPDRVGRICSNSADEVIYRDLARGPESCRILDIEAVVDREDALAIAEARVDARRKR